MTTHTDVGWFVMLDLECSQPRSVEPCRAQPGASSGALVPFVTFVTVDGCQFLGSTLVLLTLVAGLARRLGGCQWHGRRAGQVAWVQEEGMVTAAILWRSWGTVPIRDLKYLMRKEKTQSRAFPGL